MADTTIDQYGKIRKKRTRTVTVVILVLLSLAILIGAVSLYGDNVGNFVISVEQNTVVSLSLSEKANFEDGGRSTLSAIGVKNQTDTTFSSIPVKNITELEGGTHNDAISNKFFAYNFYIKNTSDSHRTITYTLDVTLRSSTKGVDRAMRFYVWRSNEFESTYAKPNTDEEADLGIVNTYNDMGALLYGSKKFESAEKILHLERPSFQYEDIDKFTIIMWLEGWDPDCTDLVKGGTVMLDMDFNILQ